jgi:hypothetical protein
MKPEEFLNQAVLLTGTDLKGDNAIDHEALNSILADDSRQIDCSQLNELLLLVHKDRVEGPFFTHFWGNECTIGSIPEGVSRFRKVAMLLYGNFVFAYRTLSRVKDNATFQERMGEAIRDPEEELVRFMSRRPKLLDFKKIERDLTPFVGYLSAGQIAAERERCDFLNKAFEKSSAATWLDFEGRLKVLAGEKELAVLLEILNNYRARYSGSSLADFGKFVKDSLAPLEALDQQVGEVRKRATDIQNTYLTWDHMDVYFATSMRKAWEYKDLYNFIDSLMQSPELKDLGIRYFDPTQAFTTDRINKGLVEALMLKRARCTVYSVQDTDTLGKDSELASTLAQGKPVIAYIPRIDAEQRARDLQFEDPTAILERLRFVIYADEQFAKRLEQSEYSLVDEVQDALEDFVSKRIWVSLPDEETSRRLKDSLSAKLKQLCAIIAAAEGRIYDNRANTLTRSHPLAIQVNLETGVANGVLVVRSISDCAELLRQILLFDMDFTIEDTPLMCYLREKISGCVYRVVTHDQKLSNCFWNFYLH